MSSGNIERRAWERETAERTLNDALTRVDQALLRNVAPSGRSIQVEPDLRGLRDSRVDVPPSGKGWRGRLARIVWRLVSPGFQRQQDFNDALVRHLEETSQLLQHVTAALPAEGAAAAETDLRAMLTFNSTLVQYLQQIPPFVDTKIRAVESSLDEVRMTATAARRAAFAARRELEPATVSPATQQSGRDGRAVTAPSPAHRTLAPVYVAFEDLFRGTAEEIRARQIEYADRFSDSTNVLDIGCGRGELLELLRERGISATGIDLNPDAVDACRARGLQAYASDAIDYLERVPDNTLGGVAALQVVEHLQPEALVQLLAAIFAKLKPGARIVLETINPACWVAFFESYIRDITHVRPLHPDTLKFLVVATGFERVDVHYRSPVSETGRLQPFSVEGLPPQLAGLVQTMNNNVACLNERLFTYQDYAVIGAKPTE